jgi:ATP-dependent RNA helicase DDX21
VVTLYGGASISEQIRTMERGVAIIVATPGRLIDLIDKGAVDLRELEAVCLDEADTMLEKGFKLDVERIMEEVSEAAGETQNLMFSATIPPWVAKIASHYLKNMKKINLINESEERTSQTVEHYALLVKEKERHETVLQLIQRFNPENRTIVFTQTKMEANDFIKYFDRD